ncbi:O-antigen ligase family protein [Candidatus Sumerlaeota bacterium]|nr:O-antigen ligase family protein [Candidatus Sumerlaeota bacterium]
MESSPRLRLDPVPAGIAMLCTAVILWRFDLGQESFNGPKFALWTGGLAVLIALAAIQVFRGGHLWILATPTAIALLVCLLWAELSATWASSDLLARRALGDWWVMLWTLLLVQHAVWVARCRGLRCVASLFVLVGSVVAVWAIVNDFMFEPGQSPFARLEDWRGGIVASLGNTSHIGDLLGLAMLPALLLFGYTRRPVMLWLTGIACVVLAAAMVVSFSFHSDIALIVGALIVIVGVGRRRRRLLIRRWRRFALLGAAWLAVLLFHFGDVPGNPHRPGLASQAVGSDRLAWGWDSRLAIWSNTLAMIGERPWFGWGVGCFTHGWPQQSSAWVAMNPDPRIASLAGRHTNAAHSEILQLWAELGIVGLAMWVVLFALHFQACARLMRHESRPLRLAGLWLMALTVMWLLQAQMNFPLQMPVGRLMLVVLLGIAAALDARHRPEGERQAFELTLPLRGWKFAVASLITIGIAGYHVGHAAVQHIVLARFRAPYELSTIWGQRRSAWMAQGAPPQVLGAWADSELAWDAVEAFNHTLELDPEFTDAVNGLGGMAFRMGTDCLLTGVGLPEGDPEREAWRVQGENLLRASIARGHEALRGLQEAELYRRMALAHDLLGEIDEARPLWIVAFERSPMLQSGADFARWMSDPAFRQIWLSRGELAVSSPD